ncbi:MAG: hypothetical protein MUF27_08705 [Acidobacteria bacterium]|nr:hypothetical protein [Acidobacteriota bacterium]
MFSPPSRVTEASATPSASTRFWTVVSAWRTARSRRRFSSASGIWARISPPETPTDQSPASSVTIRSASPIRAAGTPETTTWPNWSPVIARASVNPSLRSRSPIRVASMSASALIASSVWTCITR